MVVLPIYNTRAAAWFGGMMNDAVNAILYERDAVHGIMPNGYGDFATTVFGRVFSACCAAA